jgi:hypothetical protein
VSQHSHAQQQVESSGDIPPPLLYDNQAPPTRLRLPHLYTPTLQHGFTHSPGAPSSPSRQRLPRFLPLLSAALVHNCCAVAEAFRGAYACFSANVVLWDVVLDVFAALCIAFCGLESNSPEVINGQKQTMEFNTFVAACNHLLGQQVNREHSMHLTS